MDNISQPTSSRGSWLIATTIALMSLGVVMVYSATASLAPTVSIMPAMQGVFFRQLIFVGLGIVAIALAMLTGRFVFANQSRRKWFAYFTAVLAILALLFAILPGLASQSRGSSRWIALSTGLGPVGFQPSELAKLSLIIFLAYLLAGRKVDVRSFLHGFLPAASTVGVFVALVGKEDFGTACLFALVGGAMLLLGGCRLTHLALVAIIGAAGMAALLKAEPYRLARLTSYLNIWADPQGHGYQPIQSLTAITSGGWLGTGLGGGIQKYGYLPESQTDFIFSVICEEAGIVGGWFVIALYCTFVWIGLRITMSAVNSFERLLAFGLTTTLGLQAAMNIAVVTVVTPTTGISLPFISAGGSGIVAFSLAVGLLMAIAYRSAHATEMNEAAQDLDMELA